MVKEIYLDGRVVQENVNPSAASETTRSLINLVNLKEYIIEVLQEAGQVAEDKNFAEEDLQFDNPRTHDANQKSLTIENIKNLRLEGGEESTFYMSSESGSSKTKAEIDANVEEIKVKHTNTDTNSTSQLRIAPDETYLSSAVKVSMKNNTGVPLLEVDSLTKELTAHGYPHTRNDSADFTPVNFLYSDDNKKILSAPLSMIPGANTTLNNYSCIGESSKFNPSAGEVTSGTASLQLPGSEDVAFVTINGQVIASSEYSLTGSVLSLTPLNGFINETDEILVFQHSFIQNSMGTTIVNNYSVIGSPSLFNPNASGVTSGSQTFQLGSSGAIAIVTVNGQTIDDSEYSLTGLDLTVTPDNGFSSIGDEILVYQNTISVNSDGGLKLSMRSIDSVYTVVSSDYFIEITANSFTVSMFEASGNQGQVIEFKNNGGGTITLAPVSGETIGGQPTLTLASGEGVKLISNGLVWITK